ncbi:aminofutalosine synthase MqnE [Desulforamulus hydrothermalis]|uniref:Aminodeoxyfutalosine synthase n=1 Tax=Desulforamulus hydrothermalis Lam5 = DSM 18033 TaxID=1121428 RepID=K8E682_9FIRM|nr:aminofutalosine synthase MqnE [Desulforamulus hydrothermalis]CCO06958.1 Radical SAM domain protein [Desulforamulus hydrothermalis Lam5 = DSM 18033]SHG98778.1 de-hypoxanthine futalosine cyclase [Desulforamulus hydrothermalis Lam5 = DSM 18033]
MHTFLANHELADIEAKVTAGERLSREDGIRLYRSPDLLFIGYLANLVRTRKNGNKTYFNVNRHINHTNVCKNLCQLCAFGRKAEDPGAYTLSLDEVEAKARECHGLKISEIHIVGGLNPELKLDYYLAMLRRVRTAAPNAAIKAFTAVEIDYLATLHNMSLTDVIKALREAGLDSLPGGGAEIFAQRVRDIICSQKISARRWLEVHAAAHGLGMKTNATMLYGHVETIEERIDHLIQLRLLQDRTGGFLAFIPLAFHPRNTALADHNLSLTTGFDDLKTLAIARLMLDNFDHIKAYWVMLGPKIAQVALHFGADDLDGTVVEEKIVHEAGAATAQMMAKSRLINLIKSAGKEPVERDTLYNVIEEGF